MRKDIRNLLKKKTMIEEEIKRVNILLGTIRRSPGIASVSWKYTTYFRYNSGRIDPPSGTEL